MRLAIITTHPIQYYTPVFKLLNQNPNISVKVFYTWGEKALEKFDPGFGKKIDWDIPLLNGYDYEWVKNTATDPGSHHFTGIINPDLINQVRTWQPDALLIFGWAYRSHLKAIRYFKNKIPVYFRGDSTLIDIQPGVKAILRSLLLKWVYRHIDHAFYAGTNNKAYFKQYGLKDDQLTFAPHAIDNDRFAADNNSQAKDIRESLNISADDILVLFAGKLEQKKSPQMLLKAFLALNMPQAHLLFTGNGMLENLLKQEAGDNKNIHFIGFQNQSLMPAVYQACDLFCLPSKGPGETWGLAINEAMACGKAVLVSDKVGCAADLVTNKNGMIFKSESIADLTSCLKELLTNKKRLHKYGQNASALIKSWSLEKQVKTIENKLLNETSRSY